MKLNVLHSEDREDCKLHVNMHILAELDYKKIAHVIYKRLSTGTVSYF